MIRDRGLLSLIAVLLVGAAARFIFLETSPPGFYIDESSISAHVMCVRQTGANAYGERLPLFSAMGGGGHMTASYLYPALAWTALFGDSILSYRALAALFSVLALIGLFFLGQGLFGNPRVGLFAALVGAVSPWAFQFARISWDPASAPAYLIGACALYIRARTWRGGLIAGALLAVAMYNYPPLRLQAVLVAITLLFWKRRRDAQAASWQTDTAAIASTVALCLPLIFMTISGELQARFQMLSIFSPAYLEPMGGFSWPRVTGIFLSNMAAHFNPRYLFVSGDANLRHSTQSFGLLGPLEIAVLCAIPFVLAAKREKPWAALAVCVLGFLAGIVPAALTWESVPHALRSLSAWPFMALLLGWTLAEISRHARWTDFAIAAVAAGTLTSLLYVHWVRYPRIAPLWFDASVVAQAQSIRTPDGWARFLQADDQYLKLAKQYYLMTYGGQTCLHGLAP